MNIYRGARYSFIMLGVVVVTLCQTATAANHCKTYNLNPENISVATPGATFSIKNKGPNPVKIVYNDEKNIVASIDSGKGTFFAGNASFKYYVMLTNKSDTTTIELCPPSTSSNVSSEDADIHKGYQAFYYGGDAETAVRLWEPLAERGNKIAQNHLGILYSIGDDTVQQNYKKAVGWYRKSAAQGFHIAQYKLGLMYEEGQGVPRNIVLSHMWVLIAASQEYPGAKRKVLFNNKNMSSTDITKAQELARECAKNEYKGC